MFQTLKGPFVVSLKQMTTKVNRIGHSYRMNVLGLSAFLWMTHENGVQESFGSKVHLELFVWQTSISNGISSLFPYGNLNLIHTSLSCVYWLDVNYDGHVDIHISNDPMYIISSFNKLKQL